MQKTSFLFWLVAIGFALLLVSNVYFLTQNKSLKKDISVQTMEYEKEKRTLETRVLVLETCAMMSTKSNGKLVNGNIPLIDVKNEKHLVKEIFKDKTPCLVFRYSQGDCSSCVNTVFEYLWELKNSVEPNKLQVVIVPYFTELRAMIAQNSQSVKKHFSSYLTDEKGFGLPIDKDYVPYLFILDENKRTSNMFVVDMTFQPLLEKYFNVLIENYK